MVSKEMFALGNTRSCIRELFEYGNQKAQEIGRENVFDFSIGNPSIPAPKQVAETITHILETENPVATHGYSSAAGYDFVREAIAADLNRRYNAGLGKRNLFMTCGAAPALTAVLRALTVSADTEVVAIAPFFPEYRVFVTAVGAKLQVVPADTEAFQIDFAALEARLNENTQAVIINSPNNPSGVVYTRETLQRLCDLLRRKSDQAGHPIYLISDEPYRELVYGDVKVPYLINEYKNTVVCYSFSKSLSLPGERIGYILVSPRIDGWKRLFLAVCGAGRSLGFVCAPSLFQKLIPHCLGKTADIEVYDRNRRLIYDTLTKYGFKAVKPDGAFYLFVRTPEPDAYAFCERAKKHELLLVPSDDFGVPGFVRISYCVSTEQIERSLPAFKALAIEYGLC